MKANRWVSVIRSEVLAEFKHDLEVMAAAEDSLSKARDLEALHYQRGKVAGIRAVLFRVTGQE